MTNENASQFSDSAAQVIARFLAARGIDRIFGLCGGHIQPIWDRVARLGIRIIDVRDERAAVHMAHAHAELTGGLGVAMVTAGPGVTNAMTGIVNAHMARAPVLVISGVPPISQEKLGALQDLVHTDLVRTVTRYARTVRRVEHVLPALDEAVARAMGEGNEPGPVYLDFPTDLLRQSIPKKMIRDEYLQPKPRPILPPHPGAVARIVDVLWKASRPLVISGRGARGSAPQLIALLDRLGAVYLDTGESRGLVPNDHPSVVSALRGAAMKEADVVLTVGKKLDFQLAYGSPAVFSSATFVRIGEFPAEVTDNRRGAVEVIGTPSLTLEAMVDAAGHRTPAIEKGWRDTMRRTHLEKSAGYREKMAAAPPGSDGLMHPNKMLAAIQDAIVPGTIVIADGGDILSFARVGLSVESYLDPGPLGCLGIGVPFGIAAALAHPERRVIVVTGDGSFGFNAIEIDTAVRHGANAVFVIANNRGWNIEVYDQQSTYDGNIVGVKLRDSDYAALARSLGAYGERIGNPEELPEALKRAFENAPAVLDVVVTADAVSPDGKSGMASVPDFQALDAWDIAEKEWR
jgi:acetolactate synthase-1/2/3 large subunit